MHLSKDDTLALLRTLFDTLQSDVHPEASAARFAALFGIASSPGMQQADIAERIVKMSQQGSSRAVLALQGKSRSTDAYPVLVESRPDPTFTRRNLLFPTALTDELVEKLNDQFNRVLANK